MLGVAESYRYAAVLLYVVPAHRQVMMRVYENSEFQGSAVRCALRRRIHTVGYRDIIIRIALDSEFDVYAKLLYGIRRVAQNTQ